MASRRGRGEGAVEKLPSGSFRAVLSLGYDPETLKRVRLSRTFPTKREALEWREETLRQHRAGELTVTATTLGEWLDTWLALRKPDVAANTYRTEADTVKNRLRPGLGHIELRALTRLSCERWLAALAEEEVSQNERRKAAKLLRKVLGDASAKKVMGANPMAGVKIPKRPDSEVRYLTREQARALLAAAEERGHGPMFTVWLDTGARPSELYGLQWGDLDGPRLKFRRAVCTTTGRIKPLKTKESRRSVLLSPASLSALERHRAETQCPTTDAAPLFPAPRTGAHRTHRNFVRDVFEPISAAAKLTGTATPYAIRHTTASLLLAASVSLKVVSERLGHADVKVTLTHYAHLLPGMQESAAAAMGAILSATEPTP